MTENLTRQAQPDYSWGEYLGCMEGVPEDVLSLATTKPAESPAWGLVACLILTIASMRMSTLAIWPFTLPDGRHPIEPVMLSIVLGIAISNLWTLPKWFQPGIK